MAKKKSGGKSRDSVGSFNFGANRKGFKGSAAKKKRANPKREWKGRTYGS